MFRGGTADKLGNLYEAKWTVFCLLEVLANRARWLKYEGLDESFKGFEFALEKNGTVEWHQTKMHAPKGNWTINKLRDARVLAPFLRNLSSDDKIHCYFVSQDNMTLLKEITEKARITNSLAQFQLRISRESNEQFKQLNREWQCNEEQTYTFLKRTFFKSMPESAIDSNIETFSDFFFQVPFDRVFSSLREYLESNFNKELTTESIRDDISNRSELKFKKWSFDPTDLQRIEEANTAYLSTYSGPPLSTFIERSHIFQITEVFNDSNFPDLTLLTGASGSGKSVVLHHAIREFQKQNLPFLVFRIDQFLFCHTKYELGEALTGHRESPIVTLKRNFPEQTSILIVDQVDAVSEVSGRNGQVREMLFRLLEDSKNLGLVKIVLVCRTFDFESDGRFRELQHKRKAQRIEVPLLNWNKEIVPHLKKKEIDSSLFTLKQKELLSLPINFSLFLDIGISAHSLQSPADLYRALIKRKQITINNKVNSEKWALMEPLQAISSPSYEEFKITSGYNKDDHNFDRLFQNSIWASTGWLKLLNESGWIIEQLNSSNESRSSMVWLWLSRMVGKDSKTTVEIVRNWWMRNRDGSDHIFEWFGKFSFDYMDENVFELIVDIIQDAPKNLFNHKQLGSLSTIIYQFGKNFPEYCGQILNTYFGIWFKLMKNQNPFAEEKFPLDFHAIKELAKSSPLNFIHGVSDGLSQAVKMVSDRGESSSEYWEFKRQVYSGVRLDFDSFLEIYRTALRNLCEENADMAKHYLAKLPPHLHTCNMHLHLEAIIANPSEFAQNLPPMATNEMVFEAGWDGAEWLSFAEACKAAIPYLSSSETELLENAIFKHNPELISAFQNKTSRKNALLYLNYAGYQRWCILETIGEARLSIKALGHLKELRRKFPDKEIAQPHHNEAYIVESPIEQNQLVKMNDQQWLKAFKRYNSEFTIMGRDFAKGGSRVLSQKLEIVVKKEPERFAKLFLVIPEEVNLDYKRHILEGLANASKIATKDLVNVIQHAHSIKNKPFGRQICNIIKKYPQVTTEKSILDILIWYALYGNPDSKHGISFGGTRGDGRTLTQIIDRQTDYYYSGFKFIRGIAWDALAAAYWRDSSLEQVVVKVLDTALEQEIEPSVRCCMISPMLPLFNRSKEKFSELLLRLINFKGTYDSHLTNPELLPLTTHHGVSLFPYIFRSLPILSNEILDRLLGSQDKANQWIGAWLLFCESFNNDKLIEKADHTMKSSEVYRLLMAEAALQYFWWVENRDRAENLIKNFFNDEVPEVREQSAKIFRNLPKDDSKMFKNLASAFIQSKAFDENSTILLEFLEKSNHNMVDLIKTISQKIIDKYLNEKEDSLSREMNIHQIGKLLKREYPRTETAPQTRKVILDLIDQMFLYEYHGVHEIVAPHDRW